MSLAENQGHVPGGNPQTSASPATGPEGRARRNFGDAIVRLQEALPKEQCARLGKYKFPKIDGSARVESASEELEIAMENFINSMDLKAKEQAKSRTKVIKGMVKEWFCASYPFAELLMTIAKEASSVNIPFLNPYGIVFASLLILSKTAYEEAGREDDILSTIETLAGAINRIKLVKQLPEDISQLGNVRTAGLDLCAAIVDYLAIGIQSLKSSFKKNVLRNVFTKGDILSAALEQVNRATDIYNSSLTDMILTIVSDGRSDGKATQATVLQTFRSVRELHQKVDRIPTYHIVDLVSDTLSEIRNARSANISGMAIRSGLEIRVTRQDVLDWIFPDDFGAKHRTVKAKRVANSGSWFLNHPDFQSWAHERSSNMLFCPGLAGAGKSVITSLVIDELETRYENLPVGVAYVYFDYKNQENQSIPSIFASLLKQLVVRKDEMTPEVLAFYGRFRSRATRPELSTTLQTIVHLCTLFSSTFIILDALDELDEKHLPLLLNSLSQLLGGGQKIQVFATSRPHLGTVQNFFKSALSISIRADDEDIKNYLRIKVDAKLSEPQEDLKTKIVESLSRRADGIFLLGEAQLNYVFTFANPRRMRHALNTSVPSELFDIYETVMAGIRGSHGDKQQIAQSVLSWIFRARRPLKMSELREAIAIQEDDVELGEEDLTQVDDIVKACGSLVVHSPETGNVAFSHEMVQQFLEEKYNDYLFPESAIAKTCLAYLLFDTFDEGPAQDEETFKARRQKRPFAEYAAYYWGPHVNGAAAEDDPQIVEMVLRLGVSKERLESVAQFCLEEIGIAWQEFGPKCRGKALIHMFAEDGVVTLAQKVFGSPAENAGRPCHGIANSFARATSEEGWCPLHYAAANGHVDMITFLRDANADISAQDTVGCTALHVACRYGQAEVVKCLIEAGAEVNTVEDNGYTPLISASEAGHINIVKLLLTAKANPMSQTSDGTTSLIWAASNGHAAVVQVLLDTVAEIETRDRLPDSALHSVSENEEFKATNTSKATITFVNTKNIHEATALHYAATYGHVPVIRVLVAAQADVNVESKWGTTALHMAASDDHVSSVSFLLESNANVMARSKDEGWLALHYAARYGSPDMVRIILDAMAKFNPQSKEHRTSSNHDSHEGNAEVATSSTDMNAQEDGGQQILPGSVNNADDGMMQLPSQETGVDTGTNFGATALHMAARRGNNDMVRMLLEAKAKVNAKDKMRWAALHNAAVNGHTETVEILLAAHADPGGTTDEAGLFTPLHLAANGGHTFTIEKVLDADESIITAQDQSGQTALHIATAKGHIRTVERLLRTEEDVVHIEDQYGFTALHCAVTARRFGIARMIATHIRLNLSPKSSNDIQSALIPAPIDGTSLIDEDSEIDMDVCLEMAKLYPTIPRTHQELGRIYTAKQNYTAAISSFETALDMYLETVEFTGIEVLSHRSTVCDGCEGRPIVVGYRHKCGSCWDFDLCHKCFESSPRPHAEHEFIMIPSEEWLQSRLATAKQSEIRCMETCREAVIC